MHKHLPIVAAAVLLASAAPMLVPRHPAMAEPRSDTTPDVRPCDGSAANSNIAIAAMSTAELVRASVSDDAEAAAIAATRLRDLGETGLEALCAEHELRMAAAQAASNETMRKSLASHVSQNRSHMLAEPESTALDPHIARLRAAIDAVARQRDAWASGLYWFTDFDAAKAQAAATGRPILSLRMLGNLDEDRSCANSRFFRSILYANAQVSDYLREHFILHWESLRPVPKLTIDFGDGRRIERTITGNSIHYVLDSNGAIIDAIPGLYGPAPFLKSLRAAEEAALKSIMLSDDDDRSRTKFLQRYHMDAQREIERRRNADIAHLRATDEAAAAARAAHSHQSGLNSPSQSPSIPYGDELSDEALMRIAALHAEDGQLDADSVAMIRSKVPEDFLRIAERAQGVAPSKSRPEAPVVAMLRTLNRTIAQDTVRNEYLLHRRIHGMLLNPPEKDGVAGFNRLVYAELFLTPLDDPWMGLAPRDAYAAIDGGGLTESCK